MESTGEGIILAFYIFSKTGIVMDKLGFLFLLRGQY